MTSITYLAKDSAELVCHCNCDFAPVTFPPQMDCPWCGCGWLFTCIECRKAFTFARGIQVNESWEELALRDLTNQWHNKPSREDISNWVAAMKELLADVKVGGKYVCLDGVIIPAQAAKIRFDGWHCHHDLAYVPQAAALKDRSIVEEVLSNREYWKGNVLSDD